MDTPSPDTPQPAATTRTRFSKGIVLLAAAIIIPGLCFGIALPLGWVGVGFVLALVWVFVALATVLAFLGDLVRFLYRESKR